MRRRRTAATAAVLNGRPQTLGDVEAEREELRARARAEAEQRLGRDALKWLEQHRDIDDIGELARLASREAVAVQRAVMLDEDAPSNARVVASNNILDRAHGKPKQQVEHAGKLKLEDLVMQSFKPAEAAAAVADDDGPVGTKH